MRGFAKLPLNTLKHVVPRHSLKNETENKKLCGKFVDPPMEICGKRFLLFLLCFNVNMVF